MAGYALFRCLGRHGSGGRRHFQATIFVTPLVSAVTLSVKPRVRPNMWQETKNAPLGRGTRRAGGRGGGGPGGGGTGQVRTEVLWSEKAGG